MDELPKPVQEVTVAFTEEIDRRLPDQLTGLFLHGSLCWGEFFPGSDIDFVSVWEELPTGASLDQLREAHEATLGRVPSPVFDGFHCTAADLASDPAEVASRPVFYEGTFDPQGTIDINLVTWHELAERPVIVRGDVVEVHTDLPALIAFTRENLNTYWRDVLRQIDDAGAEAVGVQDSAIAWVALGAPRLHHVLARNGLTSKSGAGRYVIDSLAPRWTQIASEALRLRETPDRPSLYCDNGQRGRDMRDLLAWILEDAVRDDRSSAALRAVTPERGEATNGSGTARYGGEPNGDRRDEDS